MVVDMVGWPADLVGVSCEGGRSSFGLIKAALSETVDTADLNIYR